MIRSLSKVKNRRWLFFWWVSWPGITLLIIPSMNLYCIREQIKCNHKNWPGIMLTCLVMCIVWSPYFFHPINSRFDYIVLLSHINMTLVYISLTFNNPLKVCFSNKNYLITIQTHPTLIVKSIILIEKPIFKGYWCTKSIIYHFLFRFSV